MLKGNNIRNVSASLERCNITSQPTERPKFIALKLNIFNGTDDIHGVQGDNFTSISKNETRIVSSDFPINVVASSNVRFRFRIHVLFDFLGVNELPLLETHRGHSWTVREPSPRLPVLRM